MIPNRGIVPVDKTYASRFRHCRQNAIAIPISQHERLTVTSVLSHIRGGTSTSQFHAVSFAMAVVLLSLCIACTGCDSTVAKEQLHSEAGEAHHEEAHHEEAHEHGHAHKILVTSPVLKDIVSTQPYVCQMHSRRHIEVRALERGYLEEIKVKEGQAVKKGDLMFEIVPILYKAKLDTEVAEAQLVQIEYKNTKKLVEQNVVSQQELALAEAKVAKAQAQVELAKAELNFAKIKAPFDGIIDRLQNQQGSLIEEGDNLTTLSDNHVMWVYFNVPEAGYLEYKADLDQSQAKSRHDDDKDDDDADDEKDDDDDHEATRREDLRVELVLANGNKFPQIGKIGAIEADFNSETGNIAFRADFPNPTGLLRHGQTGTILISRNVKNALVIPQRATFEILAKRYAFVVGKDHVVRQREIAILSELDDIYLIKDGLDVNDKIVLEGIRQVRDGDKVEYEFIAPEVVLGNLKYKAE